MTHKHSDETSAATINDLQALSPERWAELDKMIAEAEKLREKINLVPSNTISEQYIRDRYPLALLYTRSDIQDLATCYYETALSEEEIQDVCAAFFDEFPFEIEIAIREAIESAVEKRDSNSITK